MAKKKVEPEVEVEEETGEEESVVVEVEDDTPDKDKGRERRAEGEGPDIPDKEEIEKYGEKVQIRLKKMTWEINEERRSKEEAERLRDQAVDFARAQHNEVVNLRKVLAEGETEHVAVGKTSSESQLASARIALRAANEGGDSEAITIAQESLANAVADANRWRDYRPQYQIDQNDPRLQHVAPIQRQPPTRVPVPTPEAREWAEGNTWFNKDEPMTGYAFGIHKRLVEQEGVAVDTKKYYTRLDEEMRKAFPTAFSGDASQSRQKATSQGANVVASGSRSPGTPRRVTMTTSQVALAKRLGITPEAYAAEMIKQETGQ